MTEPTSTQTYEIEEVDGTAILRVLRRLPGTLDTSDAGTKDITRIPVEKWAVIRPHLLTHLSKVPTDPRRPSKTRPLVRLTVPQGQACETFFLIAASITDERELDTAARNWFSKAITGGKRVEIGSISLAANQTRLVDRRLERSGIIDSVGIVRLPSASVDLFVDLLQRFGPKGLFDLASPSRKTKVRWAWMRTGLGTTAGLMPRQTASDLPGSAATFLISSAEVAINHQASLRNSQRIDAMQQTVQTINEKIDDVFRPDFLALVRELERELSIVHLEKVCLLPKKRPRH